MPWCQKNALACRCLQACEQRVCTHPCVCMYPCPSVAGTAAVAADAAAVHKAAAEAYLLRQHRCL